MAPRGRRDRPHLTGGAPYDVDDLLHVFAEKLARTYTVRELDPGPAALVLLVGEVEHRLYLPRPLVGAVLRHVEQHDDHPWGGDLEPVEAVPG